MERIRGVDCVLTVRHVILKNPFPEKTDTPKRHYSHSFSCLFWIVSYHCSESTGVRITGSGPRGVTGSGPRGFGAGAILLEYVSSNRYLKHPAPLNRGESSPNDPDSVVCCFFCFFFDEIVPRTQRL